jgi:DNA repair protein RadC
VNAAQAPVAEVFKEAVRANAPAIAIAHSHPSGAAKVLDIDLIDYLIVGDDRWISLRRLGIGFPAGK